MGDKSQTTNLEELAHETTGAVLIEFLLVKDVVDNMKSAGVPLPIQRSASNNSASKITNIIHDALCKASTAENYVRQILLNQLLILECLRTEFYAPDSPGDKDYLEAIAATTRVLVEDNNDKSDTTKCQHIWKEKSHAVIKYVCEKCGGWSSEKPN